MKNHTLLEELETLCNEAGYTIRKEKGTFRGDYCVMEGERLIMMNKTKPVERQLGILARVLRGVELDDIYMKPVVRKRIAELWEQMDRLEKIKMTSEEGSA